MDSLVGGMDGQGMDMSSDGLFRPYNSLLARDFWYINAGVLIFMFFLRAVEFYQSWAG